MVFFGSLFPPTSRCSRDHCPPPPFPLFALPSLFSRYVLAYTREREGGWIQIRQKFWYAYLPFVPWRWVRGGECSTECISFLYFSGKNPPCRKVKETSRERGKHPPKGKEENPSPGGMGREFPSGEGEENPSHREEEENSPQGNGKRIPPPGKGKRIPLRGTEENPSHGEESVDTYI